VSDPLPLQSAVTFTPSHLGICVADLDRSLRFYGEGLGFVADGRYDVDQPIAEIDGPARVTLHFLRQGGMRLELLCFANPPAFGRPPSVRNQIGPTHLSFVVDDVDAAAAHLVSHGGAIVEGTRTPETVTTGPRIVFVADPDGTRIELVSSPRPPASPTPG
jgi:catechol 2,3-dioxygenase-like lactoylglutathione lyase family enzyme